MDASDKGLREIKKQMTRESIAEAALKLTLERGLSNVTIEEIAQQAFVSPRTVSNYFPSKEAAVVASDDDDYRAIVEELSSRPADEPPLESLCQILVAFAQSRTRDQLRLTRQKVALEDENPSLHPFQVAKYDELECQLRTAVAERTGTDVDTDVYPWLVAAAAVNAMRCSVRMWATSGAAAKRLPELMQDAFDQIGAGLPAPAPPKQTSARRSRKTS